MGRFQHALHMLRRLRQFTFITICITTFALSTNPVVADATQRVDVAARQVMLSMRMAMSLCLVDAEVSDNYQFAAQQAIQVFNGSLSSLINGNGDGITRPENNRSVLAALGQINEMWFHLGPHYWQMSVERAPSEIVSEMIDDNILLMRLTDQALAEIQAAHSRSAANAAAITVLVQVGRLRVLSQKAVKEACFAAQQFRADEMRANLAQTLTEMQTLVPQMGAQTQSMPASESDKAEVAAAVQGVLAVWAQMQPELVKVYETGAASKPQLDQLGQMSSRFLGAADLVSGMVLTLSATE